MLMHKKRTEGCSFLGGGQCDEMESYIRALIEMAGDEIIDINGKSLKGESIHNKIC